MNKRMILLMIMIGAFIMNQIIIRTTLYIYNVNDYFNWINGWLSFSIIASISTFIFSLVFYIILYLYFRENKLLLTFIILSVVAMLLNSILNMIPVSDWRLHWFAQLIGYIAYVCKLINLPIVLGIVISESYRKIVSYTLVLSVVYAHYFSSWMTVVVANFFEPVLVGNAQYNLLRVHMPLNNAILGIYLLLFILQLAVVWELFEQLDREVDQRSFKQQHVERQIEFWEIINNKLNLEKKIKIEGITV